MTQLTSEAVTKGHTALWRGIPSSRVIVWVWLVAIAAIRAGSPEERDPYWETRAGLENLTGTPLVRPDSWSWAPVEGSFYPNSPGWNLALGLSWLVGGYWGLFLFTFAALLAYLGLAYLLARRLGAHPLGALAGTMLAFILAYPMLSARATIGVQLLLWVAIFIPLWWQRRLARTVPHWNALLLFALGAAVSAVGNWIHLSFAVMSVALAVSWTVFWLLSDWPPGGLQARLLDARRWAAVLGGAAGLCVGILATPYGIGGLFERYRVTAAAGAGIILEWGSPFLPSADSQSRLMAVTTIPLLVGLIAWYVARLHRGRIDQTFALASALGVVGVPFVIAGGFALRFLAVGILILVPVIGMAITSLAHRTRRLAVGLSDTSALKDSAVRWTATGSWRVVLSIVSLLLLPFAFLLGPVKHAVPDELAAIRQLPSGCHLFTTGGIAGPAILDRHDVPVWLDGRADYFGRARLIDGYRYFFGQPPTAAPPGSTCAVLPATSRADAVPLATARLNADPAWKRLGTYQGFDVWVGTA